MINVSPCTQDIALLFESEKVACLEPAVRLSIRQAIEQECIAEQIRQMLPNSTDLSSQHIKFSQDNRLAVVSSESTQVMVFAVASAGDVRPIVAYKSAQAVLSVDLITLFDNEPYVSIMLSDPKFKYRQVLGRLTEYILNGDEETQVNIPANLASTELAP